MISKTVAQSDLVGAIASGLCLIHCIATPFLFIAQSCSIEDACCGSSPIWWSSIDFLFIGITFLAVYQSGKNTHKLWLRYALYLNWIVLSFLILNEKFVFFQLSEIWKHMMAFGLIALHIYNLKFCKCSEEESCCVA